LRRSRFEARESAATAHGIESEFEAPEMPSAGKHTAKVDVFWFALILFEIVVGLPALESTNA
jgi:hypothetical protein